MAQAKMDLRKAAESICSAIRSDIPNLVENTRNFMPEFRKRFRTFLSTLPDVSMYNESDTLLNDAEQIAYIWLGRNVEGLMEITEAMFDEAIGFGIFDWDWDDGAYVEFHKMTWQKDYFLTIYKPSEEKIGYPFRHINKHSGLVPQVVMVTLEEYNKSRTSENYKKKIIFQGLRIDLKDEFGFLITLVNKFLGKVVR